MNPLLLLASEQPNGPWLPGDINEVIWGTISFVIVVLLLLKFGRKPAVAGLAKRRDGIAEKLGAAEEARVAAEAERDRIKAALADSDAEAARIVEEARQAADRIGTDVAARAQVDAQTVRDRAVTDQASTQAQAQADLTAELSRLALGAAERVVESSLDDAAQQRLIDDYISQVGTQN